jgi:hypothetical protein
MVSPAITVELEKRNCVDIGQIDKDLTPSDASVGVAQESSRESEAHVSTPSHSSSASSASSYLQYTVREVFPT